MVAASKVIGSKQSEHSIMLFALSTCIWCKKTKNLLGSLDLSYEFINVDELSGQDEARVMEELRKFNPHATFPTIVIDEHEVILGFREDQIKKALS